MKVAVYCFGGIFGPCQLPTDVRLIQPNRTPPLQKTLLALSEETACEPDLDGNCTSQDCLKGCWLFFRDNL